MSPAQALRMRSILGAEKPKAAPPIALGAGATDRALGGGLARAALHEVYAAVGDAAAATGFTAAAALRAAGAKSILWARQDFLESEAGALNPSGLAEFGLDPSRIVLVRCRDGEAVLRAGEQAARCAALGAVVIEPWGEPKLLDFTVSRRLALAASKSGVPIFLLRIAAMPRQSAAATRWNVEALASRALDANAPGFPAFKLSLLRLRGGVAGQMWRVEWNRDRRTFEDFARGAAAPVSGAVVSVSADRPAEALGDIRRAG